MRLAALIIPLTLTLFRPATAQTAPGASVSYRSLVLRVNSGSVGGAAVQKDASHPSFGRLLGAGALGAAAGTGVLIVAAEAIQANLDIDDEDGYESPEEARANAAAALYLLPWIGSTVAVLAVAGGDAAPQMEAVFVVGGSSLFVSLLGAGLGYVVTESVAGGVAGFAAGAGAGAALGYQAARRNGYAARPLDAHASLFQHGGGQWSLRVPSVRRVESGVPGRAPLLRLVSLLSTQL